MVQLISLSHISKSPSPQFAGWGMIFSDPIPIPTDKNGTFKKTPYGLGATPVRPGYPEKFAKQLVKQSGDKFLVPEEKK